MLVDQTIKIASEKYGICPEITRKTYCNSETMAQFRENMERISFSMPKTTKE